MSLEALQRAFQAHVTGGGEAVGSLVAARGRRGLPVYRHAYRATLGAALADVFEKTRAWLGEDAFDVEAAAYVAATQSRSWTLGDYGARFPAFLDARHPGDPEVGELAWLDWSLRQAFAAAGSASPDPAALGAIDWDDARIEFAAHVAAREVRTNVAAVWNGLPGAPVAVAMLPEPLGLIVWREQLSPRFRSAPAAEAALIAALHKRARFGAACELVATLFALSGEDIGAMLAQWLGDGLIAHIDR